MCASVKNAVIRRSRVKVEGWVFSTFAFASWRWFSGCGELDVRWRSRVIVLGVGIRWCIAGGVSVWLRVVGNWSVRCSGEVKCGCVKIGVRVKRVWVSEW